jgi:hypothetical protein
MNTSPNAVDVKYDDGIASIATLHTALETSAVESVAEWHQGISGDAVVWPRPVLCTLTVCIPLYYNPGPDGSRVAIEPEKLRQTEREIRQNFSGYSRSLISGWYRDASGAEFEDDLWRFEIDGSFDADQLRLLKSWKRELEGRFDQRAIYFRFSGPVTSW